MTAWHENIAGFDIPYSVFLCAHCQQHGMAEWSLHTRIYDGQRPQTNTRTKYRCTLFFLFFYYFYYFFFLFALYPQRPFIIWLLCAEASHCIIATKPWLQVRYIKKNEKKISTRRSNAKRLFDGVFFSCSPGMSRIRKNKSLNVLFSLHRFFFFSSVRCFFSQFRVLFFTFILHFPHEQDVKSHKLVSGFVVLQRFCCCYCCCCAPQLHVLPYSSICQPQFDSNKILI